MARLKLFAKMNKAKEIVNFAYWVIFLVVLVIAAALILSNFDTPLRFRLFSVQSGSMAPTIPVGSLVAVNPANTYLVGDVITYRSDANPKETVTHRIVEVVKDKDIGMASYRTKGDTNESPDSELITSGRVVGKVMLHIPLLGYIISFAQTPVGFVILFVIPATIIVYSELLNIKKEAAKLIASKKGGTWTFARKFLKEK